MNLSLPSFFKSGLVALLLGVALPTDVWAQDKDKDKDKGKQLKFETQLVWATTSTNVSPNPKHKPVDAKLQEKFNKLQLRWVSYFEVNRGKFSVPAGGTTKHPVSEKCNIEVKDMGGKKVQVIWFGKKGDVVGKQTQPMPKDELVILGGNAPGETAWFIILKRTE